MTDKITPLDKTRWQDYELHFHYTSYHYYDVQIDQNLTGFNVSFTKKALDVPYTANTTDKLFQPWYDDVKAWGIVEDDRLIAVIETAAETWSNRLRVTELWIGDAYHRQGIGTALMDIALHRAKEENRRAIVLETQSCNEIAIAFYLAYGFTLIGFDACCYSNNDVQNKEVRIELGLFLGDHQ